MNNDSKHLVAVLLKDVDARVELVTSSHYWFFATYFPDYLQHRSADFQREMFEISERSDLSLAVIMAFRGSAKSTIMTMSYPIWAIMGKQQKKFVIIASQTQQQARNHLLNIRRELESNNFLKSDLGPFTEATDEWGQMALYIPKYDARILAVSAEQGVRGVRNGAHRPDLIIADDVEDINSTRTKESRNKTFNWWSGELVPAGDVGSRQIVIGNLLHEDSLLMRLKTKIENNEIDGSFYSWLIVDDNGNILWTGKFPDEKAIEKEKRKIGNRIAWEREYMLHLVPDDDRIIERGMIHYYDELPVALQGQYNDLIIGVDLAISESNKADYTTMIPLSILGRGDEQRIYVMPNITNKRMSFPDTIDRLRELNRFYCYPKFYIEQTAYQAAVVQQLKTEGLDVIGVSPHSDKRSRLNMIADKIQRGVILFSRTGVEDLITQLVGFGIEKHDDLVDALTTAVLTFAISESETSYVRVGTWEDAGIANPFRRTIAPRGRDYWNRRLDDWNEATSGFWD